jgi:hypothetical protein
MCLCGFRFFLLLGLTIGEKKRMDLLLSCQFFWIHSTLKGVCHPIIVSRVPTCRHCFPQLNTRENATGFIQTWPATHSLLFCLFYFILFCFLPKKKKKCLRYLDARPGTKWHSRYENKTKNVPVLLMSFHSDNAAAMPVINRRIESRLDLSLQYIRNETEGGGECVGWSNTWNRLHWDDWDLFLVLLFFRRINEKGGIVNEGLGFQCVLVSKKRGRSRRNTHFLIAVVVTDCYGWNLMTDEV